MVLQAKNNPFNSPLTVLGRERAVFGKKEKAIEYKFEDKKVEFKEYDINKVIKPYNRQEWLKQCGLA